jgi:hypothetical protein
MADLPTVASSPQMVKIKDSVFVGGGFQAKDSNPAIFEYRVTKDEWNILPQCPAFHQGLATLNGDLISVGGKNIQEVTNSVYTFRDGRWKDILPPMPTARYFLSTVSHNNEMIVAVGGKTGTEKDGKPMRSRAVEVYTREKQWYAIKELPILSSASSMCIIGDTCFIHGGVGQRMQDSRSTQYISLRTLSNGSSTAEEGWNLTTMEHPLLFSSVVEIGGKLVAMGGSNDVVLRRGTRFISYYDTAADMWVECTGAHLPVPLYRPGVVKLADNKVMVIGGQPEMQKFSNEVYIGSYRLQTHHFTTQVL